MERNTIEKFRNMKIVDRILLNDNSYLKEFFTGYWI